MENSDLSTLPSQLPKPHTVQEQAFADYMRAFADDALIPSLRKQHEQDIAEFERRLEALALRYESNQNHQYDLIKGMDAQNGDSYRNMHDTAMEFRETAQELRVETKDIRAAKEQMMRVTMDLQHASEDIVDKNAQQDKAIESQDKAIESLTARVNSMEHDMQMLQRHDQTMLEVLMGGGATPGAISDIRELRERVDKLTENIASNMESINAKLDALSQPRGLAKIFNWANKNPFALLAIGTIILLVVH